MNTQYSRKSFYIITIIVLALWIIGTFIASNNCEEKRFGLQGMFHLDICSNMSYAMNLAYMIFNIITVLGSAYVIVMSILLLRAEP